ncbi:efflux pump antibiotic resistance protein [Aspergillus pseudocaelatus]|uniref:Efflux pump antibiotic resistance protein n=1 Tax=Aspergillus pseudocaelatus TaxID=1825620 RepID=A0ABQ6X2W2_9EURO|nr:efflux pump antibiotic resistance protein [Aspergillus pseudocaelatus]
MSVQKTKSPTIQQPIGHGSTTVQTEDLNEPAIELPGTWQLAIITVSLCCGTILVALDTTIISVAVPSISTAFQTFDDVGWYGSAYLLTVTAFQPAFGNIFQLFNAKTTYVVAAVLFEIGSVICAASPTSAAFVCGRAITGVGAAGLYQGALSIIGLTVELDQRPMYLGIVLSVFGIAACLGPPLGGILTQHATWRWCFWINLPIGAVSIVLIFCFLKLRVHYSKPPDPILARVRSLDIIGIVLTIAWVCCLILALQFGSRASYWRSSRVIGLFVGSGLLLIAFSISQWRQGERSTIPLRILRQRSVIMGAIYSFFLEISIYVTLYYIQFYFQSAQLVSPTVSGVRGIPLGISQIAAVVLTGVAVSLTGHYVPFMILGQVISIIGTVFLARLEVDTSTALWATFLVIAGVGHGMGLQMPFTAVQVVLGDNDIPIGNAITVFFSQLGAAIAIAIGESIFHTSIAHQIHASHLPIAAATVIAAGPTGLQSLTTDAAILHELQGTYAYGIRMVMYFALAATCTAVPFAFGMEWLNVKKEAEKRKIVEETVDVRETQVERKGEGKLA